MILEINDNLPDKGQFIVLKDTETGDLYSGFVIEATREYGYTRILLKIENYTDLNIPYDQVWKYKVIEEMSWVEELEG